MKIKYGLQSLLAVIFFLSAHAHAVIVDGTFTGSITYAWDKGDWNPDYLNFFSVDIADQAISGSFWYDTELAPPPKLIASDSASYSFDDEISPTKWLDFTLFVDGKALSISDDHPDDFELFGANEQVRISDSDDPTQWAHGDHFYISARSVAINNEGNQTLHAASLQIKDSLLDIIDGFDLVQDFSWSRSGQEEWGIRSDETLGAKDGQPFYAGLGLEISTLTISPEKYLYPNPLHSFYSGLAY